MTHENEICPDSDGIANVQIIQEGAYEEIFSLYDVCIYWLSCRA